MCNSELFVTLNYGWLWNWWSWKGWEPIFLIRGIGLSNKLFFFFFSQTYVCNLKIYFLFANIFRFPIYSWIALDTFHIANSFYVIFHVENTFHAFNWKYVLLKYDHGYLTKGHTEAAMFVKGWIQKFNITNLKTNTRLGFFNIEECYQSCNFGCFWWILFTVKPICCAYQNLCMTFTNILGYS